MIVNRGTLLGVPKRTSQRYRVDAKPAKGSTWVRLGRDHYAQGIVEATFTPLADAAGGEDPDRPRVWMRVGLDAARRRQVYDMRISGDEPLTSTSIRVPLEAMARAAIACLSYRLDGDTVHLVAVPGDIFVIGDGTVTVEHPAPERLQNLERDAGMRAQRNSVDDGELRRVADIVARTPYRERRNAVQAELNVSPSVAKSRIAAARRRGYINEEDGNAS